MTCCGGTRMPRIKVSGSMRSLCGAEEFCRIRSYLQTTTKRGIDWLAALADALNGIPWMPDTASAWDEDAAQGRCVTEGPRSWPISRCNRAA